jgi:hypothetical protein
MKTMKFGRWHCLLQAHNNALVFMTWSRQFGLSYVSNTESGLVYACPDDVKKYNWSFNDKLEREFKFCIQMVCPKTNLKLLVRHEALNF